eukprot:223288-Hanusia_phi.AAC.1
MIVTVARSLPGDPPVGRAGVTLSVQPGSRSSEIAMPGMIMDGSRLKPGHPSRKKGPENVGSES